MNDQRDEQHAALKAEITILQQKLDALVTHGSRGQGTSSVWRQPSRQALWLCVALAALLLPGGVIYGQQAMEALFIDNKGNVGVGTADPKATLDVRGTMLAAELRLSSVSREESDGVIAAAKYAPGLNIVGINTDAKSRRLGLWGEITQHENVGTNKWKGNNEFNGKVIAAGEFNATGKVTATGEFNATGKLNATGGLESTGAFKATGGFKAMPVELKPQGQSTPLPFQFDVGKGVGKTFSLDEHCGDRDGCRVRFVCHKYEGGKQPKNNQSDVDDDMLFISDILFFRLTFNGAVYIHAVGPREQKIGHDLDISHRKLLNYKTAWYQQSVGLTVSSPEGRCAVTVYDY